MSSSTFILIAVVMAVIGWLGRSIYDYYFMPHGRLWRLVGDHPELALKLLSEEKDCLIDPPRGAPKKNFTGPFRIATRAGRVYKVYILFDRFDEIQGRIVQTMRKRLA